MLNILLLYAACGDVPWCIVVKKYSVNPIVVSFYRLIHHTAH